MSSFAFSWCFLYKLTVYTSQQKSFQTPHDLPDVTINLGQMELFHHYLTSTSFSLNDKGQEDQMWRVVVPQQAMAHEYLMHAIFAMSALHIVHLRGSEDSTRSYMTLAQIQHEESVQLFSSDVTEINSSNYTTALLFSSMHLMFSCCVMHVSGTKQPGEHIDSLVTILTASRGYWALFSSAQQFTENMPQGERSFLNPHGLVVEDSVIQSLTALANSNAMSMQSRRTTPIYQDTISRLKACLVSGLALFRIFWSLSVNDNYMVLLRQKQQMALIILACGCSLANYAPRRWFLQNWAADVIKSITALVDPIFSPEMK